VEADIRLLGIARRVLYFSGTESRLAARKQVGSRESTVDIVLHSEASAYESVYPPDETTGYSRALQIALTEKEAARAREQIIVL